MNSNFVKAAGVGLLSLGLSILPLSIAATAQDASDTTPDATAPAVTDFDDIDFEWGWLGLLGLLGLAGLAGKKRQDDVPPRYRDPNEVTYTGRRDV